MEGYDFVGEDWPNSAEAPDEDPIDFEGHGTHVADIIAGASGVAPGASILAVKVCSAVSSSCSGLALLQGMDYALDPNGDGSIDDAVDVINMSLGSSFGQQEDDLSFASQNAVDAGVTVVASAGNSADRPYIVGSPSSTPGVISVAQTQVPSAVAYPLVVTGITPSTINNTATVDWAPIGAGFSGEVVRLGTACPDGGAYFNNNSPAGKVALIDRGTCAVSLKVDRAAKDGAIAVLIANNAPGDPPTFSFGGGDTFVPTVVISQADGNRIKTALGATGVNPAVVASVSPAVSVPLVGSMVGSSSRGPSMSFDAIKPDIGAPGASVSAIAGSGSETQAFGGTSGAAPMVAGSVALLLSLDASMDPLTVKGRLVGTGDTDIETNPSTQPGVLAPITRIGGGEVRVDAAAAASTIAFDSTPGAVAQPSLSFGFHTLAGTTTLERRLTVRNLGTATRTYTLTPAFRFADDQASGAVTPSIVGGNTVTVGAGREKTVTVRLLIDPSKAPTWPFTFAPSQMGNGSLLNGPEFDGYLTVSGGGDEIHVPWHVLPRASASVSANRPIVNLASQGAATVTVANSGSHRRRVERLRAHRHQQAHSEGPVARAGREPGRHRPESGGRPGPARRGAPVRREHLGRAIPPRLSGRVRDPGRHQQGRHRRLVGVQSGAGRLCLHGCLARVRAEGGFLLGVCVLLPRRGPELPNRVFTVPMSALGVTAASQFDFTVVAYDNYFSGAITDTIGPMTYTGGTPNYVFGGGLGDGVLPLGGSADVPITAVAGGATASPSQTGILLIHYQAAQGQEATTIEVRP